MRLFRTSTLLSALVALTLALAACGGDDNEAEGDLGEQAQSACTGSPLTEAAKLPGRLAGHGRSDLHPTVHARAD